MKTVIITQARMGSTRLPGKVMLEAAGKPLLQHHLERIGRARLAGEVVLATTSGAEDEPIAALGRRLGLRVFRGSEHDVLDRYVEAAEAAEADVVVRVTSDCPLIDPHAIDGVIEAFHARMPAIDYVSNRLIQTYPRGMDTEAVSMGALRQAHAEAPPGPDREHVTLFLWRQPERFRLANVAYAEDASRYRLTVDEPADFELMRRILEALVDRRPQFTLEDCLEVLRTHPDWAAINAHVEQKQV